MTLIRRLLGLSLLAFLSALLIVSAGFFARSAWTLFRFGWEIGL